MSIKAAYCRPYRATVWEDFWRALALLGFVVILTSVVAVLHAFGHDAITVWTVLVLLALSGLFLLVCTYLCWRDARDVQDALQRCSVPLPPDHPSAP